MHVSAMNHGLTRCAGRISYFPPSVRGNSQFAFPSRGKNIRCRRFRTSQKTGLWGDQGPVTHYVPHPADC